MAWTRAKQAMQKVMTGAGVTASEQAIYIRLYMPVAGDTSDVVADKRRGLANFIKSNAVRSGPAAPIISKAADDAINKRAAKSAAAPRPAPITDDENAAARAWIAANPNDPRAATMKARLGM